MNFASPFDAQLADLGPPAIFVPHKEREWRLAPNLTRDAWGLLEAVPVRDPAHALYRDKKTGYVSWFYTTARSLLAEHPRADVCFYPSEEEAAAALAAIGLPPLIDSFP